MSGFSRKQWTRQPQFITGLDTGNPLFKGLVSIITPIQKVPTVISGVINTSPSPGGIGFDGTMRLESSPSYEVAGSTVLTFIGTKALTAALVVAASNTAGTARIWLGLQSTNALAVSNSTTDLNLGTAAAYTDYAVVLTVSGGLGSGYVNGVFRASATFNSSGVGNLTSMDYGGGGFSWPHRSYMTVAWNRVLTEAEIVSISANPWQIFQPLWRIYLLSAAAAGTTFTRSQPAAGGSLNQRIVSDTWILAVRQVLTPMATPLICRIPGTICEEQWRLTPPVLTMQR